MIFTDGCRYHCDFCCVKTNHQFQPRSQDNILQQIQELQRFYGPNLSNYNAVFLGNHDALGAGPELIRLAATEAYTVIEAIGRLPYYTYVNIGFKSADAANLRHLNKSLEITKIEDAFQMMLDVNRNYHNIEIKNLSRLPTYLYLIQRL